MAARMRRLKTPGRSTIESHLPEHRRDLRHRSHSHWAARAAKIGPETARLVEEVFEIDNVLSQLRRVQAIVGHLEGFPQSRAEATSKRACFCGTYTYKGVKLILSKALGLEPLPAVVMAQAAGSESPRFARNLDELISAKLETSHEPN